MSAGRSREVPPGALVRPAPEGLHRAREPGAGACDAPAFCMVARKSCPDERRTASMKRGSVGAMAVRAGERGGAGKQAQRGEHAIAAPAADDLHRAEGPAVGGHGPDFEVPCVFIDRQQGFPRRTVGRAGSEPPLTGERDIQHGTLSARAHAINRRHGAGRVLRRWRWISVVAASPDRPMRRASVASTSAPVMLPHERRDRNGYDVVACSVPEYGGAPPGSRAPGGGDEAISSGSGSRPLRAPSSRAGRRISPWFLSARERDPSTGSGAGVRRARSSAGAGFELARAA